MTVRGSIEMLKKIRNFLRGEDRILLGNVMQQVINSEVNNNWIYDGECKKGDSLAYSRLKTSSNIIAFLEEMKKRNKEKYYHMIDTQLNIWKDVLCRNEIIYKNSLK